MKVALCLAGGGIKGAAHVGALKAFEEENIKFDYISGTSSGTLKYEANVSVTATPKQGFVFAGWKDNSTEKIISSSATYTFTMPAKDLKITATFSFDIKFVNMKKGKRQGSNTFAHTKIALKHTLVYLAGLIIIKKSMIKINMVSIIAGVYLLLKILVFCKHKNPLFYVFYIV